MPARKLVALGFLLALLTLAAALAHASEGTAPEVSYTLERAVVGAGGPRSEGGGFELEATAGQPAAGPAIGAVAGLVAGFWGAPPLLPNSKFLPLVFH